MAATEAPAFALEFQPKGLELKLQHLSWSFNAEAWTGIGDLDKEGTFGIEALQGSNSSSHFNARHRKVEVSDKGTFLCL